MDLLTLMRCFLNQQNLLQFKEIFSLTVYQRNYFLGVLYGVIGAFGGKNCEKRPQMKKKKVFFQQNNAPCDKSIATMEKLQFAFLNKNDLLNSQSINQYSS